MRLHHTRIPGEPIRSVGEGYSARVVKCGPLDPAPHYPLCGNRAKLRLEIDFKSVFQRVGLELLNAVGSASVGRPRHLRHGAHHRHALSYWGEDGSDRPLVVFFFGGGWMSGSRRDYRFVADTLRELGCDVALADYRLYPEVHFEQMAADAVASVREVLRSVAGTRQIILAGHSAGAQLAMLLTLDERLLGPDVTRIGAVIGLAGPYDFIPFKDAHHEDLFGPDPVRWPDSQPVRFVRPGAPHTLLLHGMEDQRVRPRQSRNLAERLQEAGVPATWHAYPGMGHVDVILAFAAFMRRRSPVIAELRAFLKTVGPSLRVHQ